MLEIGSPYHLYMMDTEGLLTEEQPEVESRQDEFQMALEYISKDHSEENIYETLLYFDLLPLSAEEENQLNTLLENL